ncbi:MAG: TadE family protein [Bryobacterales bacterium]|nr:TadE family protein [Bryobacterales bacterium]
MNRWQKRGATTIEMTLVGVPLIFVMISIFEVSRGMWMYHTAAHAVKKGVRFATVHGLDCVTNLPAVTNNCTVTANDIAAAIQYAGVGLPLGPSSNMTTLTFSSLNGSFSCPLDGSDTGVDCAGVWPPAGAGADKQGNSLRIIIKVPFPSALAMFWPGSTPVSFALTNLYADSADAVQF